MDCVGIAYRREIVPLRGLRQHKVPGNIDGLDCETFAQSQHKWKKKEKVKVPVICVHCLRIADYKI